MQRVSPLEKKIQAQVLAIVREDDSPLAVAVSGGLDSTFLLTLVHTLLERGVWQPKHRPFVVHINHKLRGKESDGDEAFVRALCARMNLALKSYSLAWEHGERASQNACRKKRQIIFQQLQGQIPTLRFFLAHHRDDLAETIFHRLMRGTGIRGLVAMQVRDKNYLRPLLSISHSQILRLAQQWSMEWREDSSNKKNTYTRNWIRHEVFPLLETRYPQFSEKLVALSAEVKTAKKIDTAEQVALPLFKSMEGYQVFQQADLQGLSTEQVSKLFSLDRKHSFELVRQLKKPSVKYTLPNKRLLWVSGTYALLTSTKSSMAKTISVRGSEVESALGNWSISKMPDGIQWRIKRSVEGAKLKRAFIKHKVPAFFREEVPVLQRQGESHIFVPKKLGHDQVWDLDGIKVQYVGKNSVLRRNN